MIVRSISVKQKLQKCWSDAYTLKYSTNEKIVKFLAFHFKCTTRLLCSKQCYTSPQLTLTQSRCNVTILSSLRNWGTYWANITITLFLNIGNNAKINWKDAHAKPQWNKKQLKKYFLQLTPYMLTGSFSTR